MNEECTKETSMKPPKASAPVPDTESSGDEKVVKKRTWKKPKDKPKRPLSAYNIFFQHQRFRLVEGRTGEETPEEVVRSIEAILSKSRGKRRHRKTHGRISFGDLARAIADRWKAINPTNKAIFDHYAEVDMLRYRREVKIWKEKKELEMEAKTLAKHTSFIHQLTSSFSSSASLEDLDLDALPDERTRTDSRSMHDSLNSSYSSFEDGSSVGQDGMEPDSMTQMLQRQQQIIRQQLRDVNPQFTGGPMSNPAAIQQPNFNLPGSHAFHQSSSSAPLGMSDTGQMHRLPRPNAMQHMHMQQQQQLHQMQRMQIQQQQTNQQEKDLESEANTMEKQNSFIHQMTSSCSSSASSEDLDLDALPDESTRTDSRSMHDSIHSSYSSVGDGSSVGQDGMEPDSMTQMLQRQQQQQQIIRQQLRDVNPQFTGGPMSNPAAIQQPNFNLPGSQAFHQSFSSAPLGMSDTGQMHRLPQPNAMRHMHMQQLHQMQRMQMQHQHIDQQMQQNVGMNSAMNMGNSSFSNMANRTCGIPQQSMSAVSQVFFSPQGGAGSSPFDQSLDSLSLGDALMGPSVHVSEYSSSTTTGHNSGHISGFASSGTSFTMSHDSDGLASTSMQGGLQHQP